MCYIYHKIHWNFVRILVIYWISQVCMLLGTMRYLLNFSPLNFFTVYHKAEHTHMTVMNRIILNFWCQWCEQGADVPADLEQILMNTTGTLQWWRESDAEWKCRLWFGLQTCWVEPTCIIMINNISKDKINKCNNLNSLHINLSYHRRCEHLSLSLSLSLYTVYTYI